MRYLLFFAFLLSVVMGSAQKKPLDHTVYDGWESIAERQISHNGQWVAFTVTPQEGDGKLVLVKNDGAARVEIPRGYNVRFSADSRFAVFLIKPTFAETREARIKKKRPDDMPKDSIGYVELVSGGITKVSRVKNFRMPEEKAWVVYHMEKPLPVADSAKKPATPKPDPKWDSARRVIDSLQQIINGLPEKVRKKYVEKADAEGWENMGYEDADEPNGAGRSTNEVGGDLVWLDLAAGNRKVFKNVMEYAIDSIGGKSIVFETGKIGRDSLAKARVVLVDLGKERADTLVKDANDVRFMRFDEAGEQLTWLAEKDSSAKALQKFYKLYYYRPGGGEVKQVAEQFAYGNKPGITISENAAPRFSKSGKRLFFGIAQVLPLKDTSLPEFERVSVDIWHWKEDYLQPQQLRNLNRDLNRSYLSVYFPASGNAIQLADETMESVQTGQEGDFPFFLGQDNKAYRVATQWLGNGKNDLYVVDPQTGKRMLVAKGLDGFASLSNDGKYIAWYDRKARHYFTWSDGEIRNISAGIKTALWDEENDVPDDPAPYGQMGWEKGDAALYVYDRYDIWKIDPAGKNAPVCVTGGEGRRQKTVIRFQRIDTDADRSLEPGQRIMLSLFNEKDKKAGMLFYNLGSVFNGEKLRQTYPVAFSGARKAKNADVWTAGVETASQAADIRVVTAMDDNAVQKLVDAAPLYRPNPQQAQYNWMTAELISWKAYDGSMTQGILYKPENFDPSKKYPLIAYFYETLSDGLYRYQPPAPTPSRLNIPFFVSRGYLVLAPDIHYKKGQPAQDAFNYIVSGVRHVVKMGIADSTRLGIQGQSWGGIQVAQLITMTPLFKAAWAGAPVANMTSAYGGIRWESGLNRQFQYEKTQSRIGATLWERPDLYIKNSPLFHLPKVKTPLVIMHNDADGAVPWYQGIELFTGLRRLEKPVWMLNYNGEAHNLVERKNRKDIQIREQQFFDWLLMGAKPPKWIVEGVPAVMKGRDWGLGD